MPHPSGSRDQAMGPHIASMQSLLEASERMSEEAAHIDPEEEGQSDKSVLAVMCAVTASASESMKGDVPGALSANLDKAVVSLGANITPQLRIFSSMKGACLAFGFPVLFAPVKFGGGGGEGGGGDDEVFDAEGGFADGGDGGEYVDPEDSPYIFDPHHFNEYPHADGEIAHASQGMGEVSYDEHAVGHQREISPSPSPGMEHEGDHGHGH